MQSLYITPLEPLQVKIATAAKLLDYNIRTVYRLIDRGELETVGQGRLRRITVTSLRAYQQRNRAA